MTGSDLSTKKIVSIVLLQQQILLLNLIKRRQYQIQGFACCLYYEFQRNWSKKNIILSKRTWYPDPRIIKLCFSKSMSWQMLKQPSNGVIQKSCSETFRKICRKTFVMQTIFNKVAGFQPAVLLKKVPTTAVVL